MRLKINLVAIILAIFIAGAAAPPATAAPPSDACPLLTQAEVSAVVGVKVGVGEHMTPTYLKSCVWTPPGGATVEFANVLLSLESAAAWQSSKAMLQAVANSGGKDSKENGVTMTPVSGIGDDALFSSVGGYTKLIVKKGDVAFQIVVSNNAPIEKKRVMEKALAAKVLAKL
jgi:hypothetical protein